MKFLAISVASAGLVLATAGSALAGDKDVDPRQGDAVNRICFANSLSGWRELDRRSVLVNKGVNDWYKLEMIGTCDPKWAFGSVGVSSWSNDGCISKGDKVVTPDSTIPATCTITKIYKWNEEAGADEAE